MKMLYGSSIYNLTLLSNEDKAPDFILILFAGLP